MWNPTDEPALPSPLRRTMGGALVVALLALPMLLAGCGGGGDRQAAGAGGTGETGGTLPYPACDTLGSAKTCILDATSGGPDFGQTVVLNGASVLFGDESGQPAGTASIVDTCWAPADQTEATDCTSAGLTMPNGFVSLTTIDGYPAVTFDADKIPDTTEPGEEVYPLPGYVDVSVAGRTVRIEIACCSKI